MAQWESGVPHSSAPLVQTRRQLQTKHQIAPIPLLVFCSLFMKGSDSKNRFRESSQKPQIEQLSEIVVCHEEISQLFGQFYNGGNRE